jgi:hypothetical protein
MEEVGKRATSATLIEDLNALEGLVSAHPEAIGPAAGRSISFTAQNVPEGIQEALGLQSARNPEVLDMYYRMDNLRTQMLYAMSGKQINEREYQRLEKLVPMYNTPPSTTMQRLKMLRDELQRIQNRKQAGTWKWEGVSPRMRKLLTTAGLAIPEDSGTPSSIAPPPMPSSSDVPAVGGTFEGQRVVRVTKKK